MRKRITYSDVEQVPSQSEFLQQEEKIMDILL
jgi:hypothetical protein